MFFSPFKNPITQAREMKKKVTNIALKAASHILDSDDEDDDSFEHCLCLLGSKATACSIWSTPVS